MENTMENWKVREITGSEEKSTAEKEAELLAKAEMDNEESTDTVVLDNPPVENDGEETPSDNASVETEETQKDSLSEEEVLSFIGSKYGEEITSLDDFFAKRENPEALPEDVATYLKYKQETGRGFEDFVKLNRDLDSMDEDQLLFEYWKTEKPHLNNEDVDFELSEKFSYDEDDSESVIRKRKIAKKEELAQAKKYFNNLKETYKTKVESTSDFIPANELDNFNAYKNSQKDQEEVLKAERTRSEYFIKQTNDLFTDNFEGFEFKVNDQVFKYKPTDSQKLKESQSNLNNFIGQHVDKKGYLKDAASYHKSLSLAMNPDSFARFFYEQGKSDAVGDITKESKNVNMSGVRNATQSVSSGGFKVVSVSAPSSNGLRIKSNKK